MADRIRRWLLLSEQEWPTFLRLAGVLIVLMMGIEMGRIGRDSYFLSTAGPGHIPLVYPLLAVMAISVSLIYGRHASKVDNHQLLRQMQLGAAVISVVLCLVTYQWNDRGRVIAPYIVFCVVELCIVLLVMQYWAYVDTLFDAWQGKRVFPSLGGVGLLGTLIGGLAATVLSAQHLLVAWGALLVFCLVLTTRCARHHPPPLAPARSDEPPALPGPEPVFPRIWRLPLMRTICFMTVPLWVTAYIIEFNYLKTMSRASTQGELAQFLGLIVAISALLGFILQFTVTPRLLRRFGVGATGMVYPLSLTAGCSALLVFSLFPGANGDGSLELLGIALLVVFARLSDVSVYYSVHDSVQQLLFYTVDEEIRSEARAFLSGIVIPSSMGVAGLLLVLFEQQPIYNVAFVAMALAFLLTVVALNITPDYLLALLGNIAPEQAERRAEVLHEIGKLEDSDARYVLLQSITSANDDEALFAVDGLFEIRDEELLHDLGEVLGDIRPEVRRALRAHLSAEDLASHPEFGDQDFAESAPPTHSDT